MTGHTLLVDGGVTVMLKPVTPRPPHLPMAAFTRGITSSAINRINHLRRGLDQPSPYRHRRFRRNGPVCSCSARICSTTRLTLPWIKQ